MADDFFKPLSKAGSDSFFKPLQQKPEREKRPTLPKIGIGKEVAEENRVPEMQRDVGRAGKVIGSTLAGMPGDIQEAFTGLAPKGVQSLFKAISPTGTLPTTQELSQGVEQVAPSTKPRSPEEKDWEENLSVLTGVLAPFPTGKSKFVDPVLKNSLYQAGKRLGLSEKELAPLFKGKITEKVLSFLARQGAEAGEALNLTRNALGDVYQTIKSTPQASTPISQATANKLTKKIGSFANDLSKTLAASPERQSMISMLERAQEKLKSSGATPEELINFYQDINQSVNWKAIKGGKKQLAQVKEYVKGALKEADPALAHNFETANKLWEKSASVIKSLGRGEFEKYLNISAYTGLAGALATGNLDYAEKIALSIAGKKAMSKIATKLLTDPKWHNIHGRLLHAIKNKSPKAAQASIQTLKNRVREEMPEEFKEIDWDFE